MHIEIALAVVFTTPFNVGAGALAEQLTDRPTIKDGWYRPLLPGSALKGRLRHTTEALLRTLRQDDLAACRSPSPDTTCPLDPARLGDYCPICRLFGAPRRPSPLYFSDLRRPSTEPPAPVLLRAGVSIRRNRRVAEAQRLYDQEAVAAGAALVYRGVIAGHLMDDDAPALLALLWGGLRALDTLGGGRTGGLGRCRISVDARRDGQPADAAALEEGLRQWHA
jgi:CRISPR/Cas system CSM-associated protein Csm3 (group 7 of RAMP superfamily)